MQVFLAKMRKFAAWGLDFSSRVSFGERPRIEGGEVRANIQKFYHNASIFSEPELDL
ncbi:MAG: hypothetical protein LBJ94_01975 [Puniceicoccales bacterium]|jgi:hypothetical protein|nr:hypothetical protein [Puniceicoccales bacterium]